MADERPPRGNAFDALGRAVEPGSAVRWEPFAAVPVGDVERIREQAAFLERRPPRSSQELKDPERTHGKRNQQY